jgi:hypothetical protein
VRSHPTPSADDQPEDRFDGTQNTVPRLCSVGATWHTLVRPWPRTMQRQESGARTADAVGRANEVCDCPRGILWRRDVALAAADQRRTSDRQGNDRAAMAHRIIIVGNAVGPAATT